MKYVSTLIAAMYWTWIFTKWYIFPKALYKKYIRFIPILYSLTTAIIQSERDQFRFISSLSNYLLSSSLYKLWVFPTRKNFIEETLFIDDRYAVDIIEDVACYYQDFSFYVFQQHNLWISFISHFINKFHFL